MACKPPQRPISMLRHIAGCAGPSWTAHDFVSLAERGLMRARPPHESAQFRICETIKPGPGAGPACKAWRIRGAARGRPESHRNAELAALLAGYSHRYQRA